MSTVASGGAVGQPSRWAVLGEAAAVLWLPALVCCKLIVQGRVTSGDDVVIHIAITIAHVTAGT